MSQSESLSWKGSMDIVVAESFSKVSISQINLIQEDPSVALPSLTRIIFGSTCQNAIQAYDDSQLREKNAVVNNDALRKDSRKRDASNELQKQMALLIDSRSMQDQHYFDFINLESISSLPLRSLSTAKSLIKAYANQQAIQPNQSFMQRKISLFACLLIAALELKETNIQELQGQVEQNIFSFGEKQLVKYITRLTDEISKAIELNKQNKECTWSELESKIKDPVNKTLRKKFLSLTKFEAHDDYVKSQQYIQQASNKVKGAQFVLQANFHGEAVNDDSTIKNAVKQQDRFDAYQDFSNTDKSLVLFKGSDNPFGEQNKLDQSLKIEKQYNHLKYDAYSPQQTAQYGEVSENNPIIIDIRAAFLLEKMEKVNIGVIKDCSNATEGFLTEIQVSLDEINQKKEDSELFKSSSIVGFLEDEVSIINISSIL